MNLVKCFVILLFVCAHVQANTLCESEETTFFNCLTNSKKIISLCGSPDITKEKGYLQYRFGKKGKVELTYPENKNPSASKFFYVLYTRPSAFYSNIKFTNSGIGYEIFINSDPEMKPVKSSGVTVTTDKKTATIQCKELITASIQKLEGIVSCDPVDALNMDGCPK